MRAEMGARPGGESVERVDGGLYRSASPEATARLGIALGGLLRPGDVIVLSGDLGAGKTRLTSGVARGLGDEAPVTSPTFTIMCVHDGGRIPLYHFDLYRLDDPAQLDDVGIYDVLDDDGACLVEWGEAYVEQLGEERLDVTLLRDEAAPRGEGAGEPPRLVRAIAHGTRAQELLGQWDEEVCRAAGGAG